jgi:hypothetical protein
MAMEAGGVKKSPTARAALGTAVCFFISMAISHAVSSDPTHRIVNNERAAGEARAPIPMQCPLLGHF